MDCESAQEVLDTVIQAYRIGEQVQLPVLVNQDAFYVSHALEPVSVPAQQLVDDYLPPYAPAQRLDTALGQSWGNVVTQDMFCRHRQDVEAAMAGALAVAQDADRVWSEATGRSYGLLERYRCDGARVVVVALGSMCGTAREAVDAMRADGVAVGLLKLRLLRPLPVQALRVALAGVPDVVVLDRNHSPGLGGILHQELRAALYKLALGEIGGDIGTLSAANTNFTFSVTHDHERAETEPTTALYDACNTVDMDNTFVKLLFFWSIGACPSGATTVTTSATTLSTAVRIRLWACLSSLFGSRAASARALMRP